MRRQQSRLVGYLRDRMWHQQTLSLSLSLVSFLISHTLSPQALYFLALWPPVIWDADRPSQIEKGAPAPADEA